MPPVLLNPGVIHALTPMVQGSNPTLKHVHVTRQANTPSFIHYIAYNNAAMVVLKVEAAPGECFRANVDPAALKRGGGTKLVEASIISPREDGKDAVLVLSDGTVLSNDSVRYPKWEMCVSKDERFRAVGFDEPTEIGVLGASKLLSICEVFVRIGKLHGPERGMRIGFCDKASPWRFSTTYDSMSVQAFLMPIR